MGRPIKNKYINPYGAGTSQPFAKRPGIGGEGVTITSGNASPTFSDRGSGYFAANVSASVSAPQLTGGATATVNTVYLFANGAIKDIGISSVGSGYTSAPTVTFFGANSGPASATIAIDAFTTLANSIIANCFFTSGSQGVVTADLVKARGARTFVANNAGTLQTLKLVTSPNLNPYSAGTLTITAEFIDESQFNVAKITNRKVYSSTGQSYKWSFGTPANVSASDITVRISSK
jgi:hypothetical protein